MNIKQLAEEAGLQVKRAIELMSVGVAFPETTQMYRVFDHDGNDLGLVRTIDVESAICFMKSRGVEVGKTPSTSHTVWSRLPPAFSFTWSGWLGLNDIRTEKKGLEAEVVIIDYLGKLPATEQF